jgi:hypothetical protein
LRWKCRSKIIKQLYLFAGRADNQPLAITAWLTEIEVAVVVRNSFTMRINCSEFRSRHHSDRTPAMTEGEVEKMD